MYLPIETATYNADNLPRRLNCPFSYQPSAMMQAVAGDVRDEIDRRDDWREEIRHGKMFGVLIVADEDGKVGYLKAYSGQIGGRENWQGWVPAVFDYLQPDGYFVTHEAEISAINAEVAQLESSPRLALTAARLAKAEEEGREHVERYRRYVAEQKARRAERRANGEEEAALIAESQFQKAELRRLRKSVEESLVPLRNEQTQLNTHIAELRRQRKQKSDALQTWLFDRFVMLNGKGEKRTLTDIFAPTAQRVPPSGAGECCAPKLLQYAYRHGYRPLEIAEFWWGESPKGEIRRHREFYPACQGKCKPILDFMLQGIDVEPNPFEEAAAVSESAEMSVLYRDADVIVVDKPADMLSVPGKTGGISALERVQRIVGDTAVAYPVHRLDMQTSGVLVFALNKECYVALQREFANRRTAKTYIAVVERDNGDYKVGDRGVVDLPLGPDYINRPCQKVDYEDGKAAVTEYEIMDVSPQTLRLRLHPHHGRTHQLRVHCAHKDGLGMPIVGDNLYGRKADRMLLHAEKLEIMNPLTDKKYVFIAPCPF